MTTSKARKKLPNAHYAKGEMLSFNRIGCETVRIAD